MSSEHIIEVVSPDHERRLLHERRNADKSAARKAQLYDAILEDARFGFEFWAKLAHSVPTHAEMCHYFTDPYASARGYYEGRVHVYASILFYAGQPVACPCNACVQKRMEQAEAVANV